MNILSEMKKQAKAGSYWGKYIGAASGFIIGALAAGIGSVPGGPIACVACAALAGPFGGMIGYCFGFGAGYLVGGFYGLASGCYKSYYGISSYNANSNHEVNNNDDANNSPIPSCFPKCTWPFFERIHYILPF